MKSDVTAIKYSIERLSENNIADLEKLHNAVYKQTLPEKYFNNKYNTAFTSVQYTGYIAYHNDLPIAFYGVIPCFIRFNNKIALAAQSADTMTHPQYRNQGLFIELAKQTFALCRGYDIELLFGFPNQNSLYGFINRLGWTTTERLSCFIINTDTFWLQRIFRKLPRLKKWYNSYCKKQLKKVSLPLPGINNSVFSDNYAGVLRDCSYLNYKNYSDTHVIKLGRSVLWIKINNGIVIGDITVSSEDFDEMIDKLKKLAGKLGVKEIHFHSSPNTALHSLFSGRYNPILSFPVIFKELNGTTDINQVKFTSADIDTF